MNSRYDLMKYVRCGDSGLKLPLLSFGGWHNFQEFHQTRTLTLKAWDLGITHIDLANNYGPPPGSAEENFGRLMRADLAGHRDELILSSKAGYKMWEGPYGDWGSKKYLTASLDQSLRRLGLDYVDLFYHHRHDPETPLEETMGALALAVKQGKALYAGISNYPAKAAKKAAKIMQRLDTPLVIHQCPYNLLDRRIEDDVREETADAGLGMIVFCPLAQGMLTNRYLDGIPADSRAGGPSLFLKGEQIKADLVKKLKQLDALARQRGQSLARLALQWCLRDPRVTSVLIGASKPEQIEDCCAILGDPPITSEELVQIEAILHAATAPEKAMPPTVLKVRPLRSPTAKPPPA